MIDVRKLYLPLLLRNLINGLLSKALMRQALISLSFLSSAHLCFSVVDLHDLLSLYNLPKGLLPSDIKSCCLYNVDNSFTTELSSSPCHVNFDDHLVYYDKIIRGKLGYGKVSGVSGIKARKFFIWVTVTGIDVDKKTGMIEFHVGDLSQKLPAVDFETVSSCEAKGLTEPFSFMDALV